MSNDIKEIKRLINQFKFSRIISSAEQLGVFKLLGKRPILAREIAKQANLDLSKTELLLNGLACIGIIKRNSEGYFLEEFFDVLNPSSKKSQLNYIKHATTMMNAWAKLSSAIQCDDLSKENFSNITGNDFESTKKFINAMNSNALLLADFITERFNFTDHRILDIGAGAGTYSIAIAEKYPTVSGVLFDLPIVSLLIEENLEKNGFSEKFKVVKGDYNVDLKISEQFDDILLFAVVHQENVANLRTLLQTIFSLLREGGRLFLSSFFLNDDKVSPEFSVMFSLEMTIMSRQGHVYTHSEIIDELKYAHFQNINKISDFPFPSSLYVAQKS